MRRAGRMVVKPRPARQNAGAWRSRLRGESDDAPAAARRRGGGGLVRLVGFEPEWCHLLTEWLRGEHMDTVVSELLPDGAAGPHDAARCDLVALNLPFPRQDGRQRVQQLRQRWPATPVLLLSPTFHAGVEAGGTLARELGVQAVVAMPVPRQVLLHAVQQALGPQP